MVLKINHIKSLNIFTAKPIIVGMVAFFLILMGFFIGIFFNGYYPMIEFYQWFKIGLPSIFLFIIVIFSVSMLALFIFMKQVLLRSEVRYLKLTENMPDMFFSLDRSLRYISINNACEKFAGIKRSQVIGKTIQEIFPGRKSEFLEEYKAVLKTSKAKKIISEFKFNENTFSYIVNIYPTEKGISVLMTDITEQKESEEKLLKSENRYRQIVETAQEGIWLIDENTYTTFVNKKMCDMMEYSQEELMGKKIHSFMDIEDQKKAVGQIERRKKGINENHDSKFITKSGKILWTNISTNPVSDDNGNYTGALAMMTDITERKLAQESLQKSEANLQTIFNNTDTGYILIDKDLKVVFLNHNASQFVSDEFNQSVMDCEHLINCFPEDRKNTIKETLLNVLKGDIFHYEINCPQSDGTFKWYDAKYFPVSNSDNKIFGAIISLTDFTERKLAEDQLKQSNDRFEMVIKATNDAIWDWDILTSELYWSDGYEKLFGYLSAEKDKTVQSWVDRVHPDDQVRVTESLAREINNPNSDFWHCEYKYLKKDGNIAYIYDRGYIMHDGDKKPVRMVGAMQDITERKKAEIAIRESEEQIQRNFAEIQSASERQLSIINSLNAHIALVDEKGKIVQVNESWRGFSEEILIESNNYFPSYQIHCGIDEQTGNQITSAIKEALSGKIDDFSIEYPCNLFSETNWFRAHITPLYQNKHGGVVVSHTNITERKIAEMETLELVDILKKKNRDLRQFAFIVSHNLRAPIAKIMGLVSLFKTNKNKMVDNAILLEYVAEEAGNLDEIVKDLNQIVTVSESGNLKKEYVMFDLELSLIKQVLDNEIMESEALITSSFDNSTGVVTVKSYLYSIMYNLLSNSIKYRSSTVPLTIHIETWQESKFIGLSVKDNGMGINMDKVGDTLFGLYKRFHGSAIRGKGVGLSMVKAQIESMGGKVEVESKLNEGTIFKVYFPK